MNVVILVEREIDWQNINLSHKDKRLLNISYDLAALSKNCSLTYKIKENYSKATI